MTDLRHLKKAFNEDIFTGELKLNGDVRAMTARQLNKLLAASFQQEDVAASGATAGDDPMALLDMLSPALAARTAEIIPLRFDTLSGLAGGKGNFGNLITLLDQHAGQWVIYPEAVAKNPYLMAGMACGSDPAEVAEIVAEILSQSGAHSAEEHRATVHAMQVIQAVYVFTRVTNLVENK